MSEQWKDVVGHEGIYQVSNEGRVRRIKRAQSTHFGKIIKQWSTRKRGTMQVSLHKDRQQKTYDVHRLACIAFHGPPPTPKHEAHHKDGHNNNNAASNLEWVTPKKHKRLGRGGRPKKPLAQRLWSKVQRGSPDDCWPWLGARTDGEWEPSYGRIRDEDGLEIPVHYAVWWETNGPLPPYHRIQNTCGDMFCCNPAHWELRKLEEGEW